MVFAAGALALAAAGWFLRVRSTALAYREFSATHTLGESGVVEGAESINLTGHTARAVLLIHGFNDTPQSVSTLANALHASGWNVHAPLLPSHGRGLDEARRLRAQELMEFVRDEYERLVKQYRCVVLAGQSMGGALAVILAAEHPELEALALLAPYLGMPGRLRWLLLPGRIAAPVVPWLRNRGGDASIHDPEARRRSLGMGAVTVGMLGELDRLSDRAARCLSNVKAPTLYLQSHKDNRISGADARRFFSMLGSGEKRQHWLTGCGHVLSEDYCSAEVAGEVTRWFDRYAGSGKRPGENPA